MANNSQFGAFVPTTNVFDINTNNFSTDSDDLMLLLVRMRQTINNIALVLNIKDSGYYLPSEFVNGQLYFPNPDPMVTAPDAKNAVYRQVYRFAMDCGPLLNAAPTTVPHNIPDITEQYTATRLYACATDPVGLRYIPIPYVNGADQIALEVTATDVIITPNFDATAYTISRVVFEYLKD